MKLNDSKTLKNEAGFTLIELMNVLVISSIIAIGASIIIISSYRFSEKANQKVVLQREMNFAFELIGKRIRESDLTRYVIYQNFGGFIGLTGSCLYIEYVNSDGYYIYKQNNNLMIKKNLEQAEVILTNMVSDLIFSSSSSKIIQVSMDCYFGQQSLENSCKYRFRN